MSDNTSTKEREQLQTQLKTCSAEINEIKTKYNVKTAAQLEKKIEKAPSRSTLHGKI